MRWTSTLRLRLRSLLRGSRVERELHEEFQYHLDRLVDEYRASGMSTAAAHDAARREMGAIEVGKDACRDARGVTLVEHTRQDVGYALRTLAKSPGFAAVAIASLALGIGANAAIFTLWNGLLRAPLPGVSHPDELVILTDPNQSGSWNGGWNGGAGGPAGSAGSTRGGNGGGRRPAGSAGSTGSARGRNGGGGRPAGGAVGPGGADGVGPRGDG